MTEEQLFTLALSLIIVFGIGSILGVTYKCGWYKE